MVLAVYPTELNKKSDSFALQTPVEKCCVAMYPKELLKIGDSFVL